MRSSPLIDLIELELIQSHMTQKPVLRVEVGCACVAREVSVERGGMGERGLIKIKYPPGIFIISLVRMQSKANQRRAVRVRLSPCTSLAD